MTFKAFLSLAIVVLINICLLVQVKIDASFDNIVSSLLIAFATMATTAYLYWSDAYSKSPISSVIVLSLAFTGLFGALVFQTLYWNPVIKYLYDPVHTFSMLTFYQMVAVATHFIFISFLGSSSKPITNNYLSIRAVLTKLGLYHIPSVKTVWCLALIGLLALFIGKVLPNSIGRAIFNFNFLMWFPFFILLYIYKFGDTYANPRKQLIYVTLFFLVIVFMGIAFNGRGLIVTGLVNLFLVTTIILLNQETKRSFSFYAKFSCVILLLLAIIKPFSDFSQAMLIARSERGEITPVQMFQNTLKIYNSGQVEIENQNKYIENKVYSNYDEDYIENTILTRFVLTRFHDNAYYYQDMLTRNGELAVGTLIRNKIIAIMPQPLVTQLGIDLDKMEVIAKSTTDILVHETTGRGLWGLKVPSTFVDLEILFGVYASVVLAIMLLLFFAITELFTTIAKQAGFLISFPFFAIASKYILFQIPIYSIQGLVSLATRGFIEDVIIFTLMMYLFSLCFKYYNKHTPV
ncbi:MAG: hypothetical protein ABJH06_16010 [Paraglaciecola sp.]|uniref:hypothetical protein n=1 Tax=Paraglaciecola sp. TaxID=1920173 RepID=UPI003296F0FD